jgi:hypothetical protein
MRIYSASEKSCLYVALIIMLAAISRLCVIFFSQSEAGDTATYIKFAENIIRGCGLSHSDPSSNECILTSGGYFPGYPAFIAFVWILFGKSVYAVLIAQLICYLLALMWLLKAIFRLTKSNKTMCTLGILLALSPLQIGWFRFVLTEPLAIATATWFLAELIISVSAKNLRIFHLAIALSASIYVRPDSIFMILGPCVIAFYIYDFKKSIQQILLLIILTTIPVSVWLVRNYTIGHAPISMTTSAAPIAPGYFLWLDTWVVNEYEQADANHTVWRADYSEIKIHRSRYISNEEFAKIQLLINELSGFNNKKFPEKIDHQFYELATKKISNRNRYIPIQIYFERAFWLMLNPFSSWGLPFEMREIDRSAVNNAFKNADLVRLNQLLSGYKLVFFAKMAVFLYRVLIFATFIYLVVLFVFKPIPKNFISFTNEIRVLVLSVALVGIARIIFFISRGSLESRYLIEVVPWVESCCLLLFIASIKFYLPSIDKQ